MASGGPSVEKTLDEIVDNLPKCTTNGKRHRAAGELAALRARATEAERRLGEIAALRCRCMMSDEAGCARCIATGTPPGRAYLECSCCGYVGKRGDENGLFTDGDALDCGCPGWVSCDSESEPYINNGDEPCLKCDPTPPEPPQETEEPTNG